MKKILVLEDEASIRSFIVINLRRAGYDVIEAETGEEALERLRTNPDTKVALLDIMLPGIDGFEVCRRIRATNTKIGIIMLTARSQEMDKVTGLMTGADDYVTKPFSPREVAARVKAILKRMQPRVLADEAAASPFRLDAERMQIHYQQQLLVLTRHEFRLLQTLLTQPERVFSREQLLEASGVPSDAGYERNVDSHIKSLRAKLRQVQAEAEPIQTHRGLGYSYSPRLA